jgi:hypothetical protein
MNSALDCARLNATYSINANEQGVIIYVHSPLNASYFTNVY